MPAQYSGPTSGQYPPSSPRDARAQAKAEKAYRKAQRPLFKKKRFIFPVALILLIIVGSALNGGGNDSAPAAGGASNNSSGGDAVPAAAFGKAENGDKMTVTLTQTTPCTKGPACSVELTFTNNTKETQDELLDRSDVILVDAQDRRFEATSTFDAATVQPGGSTKKTIEFTGLPADFKPKALEVDSAGAEFTINY